VWYNEGVITRNKVISALESKRAAFQAFGVEQQQHRADIGAQIARFLRYDSAAIEKRLDALGQEWTGALPTAEWDQADGLYLPFTQQWASHREARGWALEILRDRPVLAVDGSQITPTKEYSIPVGAVQIGWFVNEHRDGGHYTKDLEFHILAPQDLIDDEESDDAEQGFPNWQVNQERFARECNKLCELMVEYGARPDDEKPLCFFDGSFIISFAGQLRPARARPYIEAVRRLLHCSTECRVPLVGFVDSSYSHDVVTLMSMVLHGDDGRAGKRPATTDAGMFGQHLTAEEWGARSPLFFCARRDPLTTNPSRSAPRADFYKDVAFTYMRLTQERPPARIEMPRWLVDEGRVTDVLNLVRAECIVGAGYPYAIEAADALAVINQQDRQRFYAWFEQFAISVDLPFMESRKSASKRMRR
jgi:hypothetical protein